MYTITSGMATALPLYGGNGYKFIARPTYVDRAASGGGHTAGGVTVYGYTEQSGYRLNVYGGHGESGGNATAGQAAGDAGNGGGAFVYLQVTSPDQMTRTTGYANAFGGDGGDGGNGGLIDGKIYAP